MTCSARFSDRYAGLFAEIQRDMDDLARMGTISRARELSAATGQWFNCTVPPGYFGGDLDAETVVVHLNPKQTDERVSPPDLGAKIETFADLIERAIHFGDQVYGPASPKIHKSRFDKKQVRFLRGLGALPFVEERSEEDRFTNLALAIGGKLQLELVPYGSPDFATGRFSETLVKPHFERVMRVVAARPRRYVLFCGAVFETVVRQYVIEEHSFSVTKNDRSPGTWRPRFASLAIPFEGTTMRAGLAASYASQSLRLDDYGEFVRQVYPTS